MQQVAQRKTQDRYRCQAWHIADQQIRIKAQPNEMQQGTRDVVHDSDGQYQAQSPGATCPGATCLAGEGYMPGEGRATCPGATCPAGRTCQCYMSREGGATCPGATCPDGEGYMPGEGGAASMDSDSYWITIDSCCSYSIAKCRRDFVGEMTRCSIQFKGFNGTNHVTCKGTWRFKLEDDNGLAHKVCIRDSLY